MTLARLRTLAGFAAADVAFWLALQLYSASVIRLTSVRPLPGTTLTVFLITRALGWALLTPFVVALVERFTWRAPHRLRNGIVLVLAVPLFAACETVLESLVEIGIFAHPVPFRAWSMRIFAQPNLLLAMLAVLAAHVVTARRQAAERGRRQVELEARLARMQAEQLRERFHPAFLYEVLSSIDRAAETDAREAQRLLGSLAELLRMAMELDTKEAVRLEEELDFVDRYAALRPSAPPLRIAVDSAALEMLVPPRTVHSFVEGIAADAASAIDLHIRAEGDRLTFSVETRD